MSKTEFIPWVEMSPQLCREGHRHGLRCGWDFEHLRPREMSQTQKEKYCAISVVRGLRDGSGPRDRRWAEEEIGEVCCRTGTKLPCFKMRKFQRLVAQLCDILNATELYT